MKTSKLFTFLLSVSLCFSGCVSQSEYDELNAQLSELQSEMTEKENIISEKDTKISNLENDIKELEENNNKINNEKNELEEKIDELENGASRLLSDVNNAFEAKNYEKAVQIANDLHKKFNGSEEDIKAQSVANQAQTELDKIEAEKKAEEERKAAEAAKSIEDKVHDIIRVYELNIDDINSADGVDVEITWVNNSSKTIKYIVFEVIPYNAVNDVVKCRIRNESSRRLQSTGPYNTGEGDAYLYTSYDGTSSEWWGGIWEAVWYNNTVDRLEFNKIEIEYMDGTTETLSDDELKYVIY